MNIAALAWPAPAKLNLMLHIIGQRQDAYHLLQTVFQFLDYSDELSFRVRDDKRINLSGNYTGIEPAQDLILRSATLLQEQCGCASGVDITVLKRIPMGAGLGGGSSNAATTLTALNKLWHLGLSVAELAEIGLGLGADVPVFVHGYSAWAEGVGEQLTPVELPENWYIVIFPDVHVATAMVFNSPDLTRNTPAITIRDFLDGAGHNDCEAVVRKLYPDVAKALDWLARKAPARLTGTGACVFAALDSEAAAKSILDEIPASWNGFIAKGTNSSPLHDRLAQETG